MIIGGVGRRVTSGVKVRVAIKLVRNSDDINHTVV